MFISPDDSIVNSALTKANVDDRNEKVIDTLTDKVFGKLYADKEVMPSNGQLALWL